MERLRKLIKEALSTPPKKDSCNCGCHSCDNVGNPGVVLNESLVKKEILSENLRYHVDKQLPLTENTFRYGSDAFLNLWAEARSLYLREIIHVNEDDKQILEETDLGNFGIYEGVEVPLDLLMLEEELIITNGKKKLAIDSEDLERLKSGKDIVGKSLEHTGQEEWISSKDNWEVEKSLNEVKDNRGELEKIKREIETLMPRLSWIDSIEYSDYSGDLDVELDYELNPQEINQLSQLASKYGMNLLYKTGKNATLTKRRIPSKANELNEAEGKKNPPLGKPKRGGSKKFYVYVKNPKTKKIKKVSFGDTTGLSAKINNPEARRAFAARHDCKNKTDKTKASYWSCRLPRYAKLLGLKSSFSGFW
jgi:hypothetical protein